MLAPAKINLALHVTGRRPDGYHLIDSLAVFTRFGDRLEIEPSERDEFLVLGRYGQSVPLDSTNLVIRARDALRHEVGVGRTSPVAIKLEKNLPVASGVGGGSTDAAATLKALARLWKLDTDHIALARIGLSLGADLPMCLEARPLIARGIGDELLTVAGFPVLALVLVNPGVAVSTPDVFKALAGRDNEALPSLPGRLDFHAVRNWLETTRNDLETPARSIEPAVGRALEALKRADAAFVRMSGSGATCFGLFADADAAARGAVAIARARPGWFVTATRTTASV